MLEWLIVLSPLILVFLVTEALIHAKPTAPQIVGREIHKEVIIIRTDTDMRRGKMCGQVAHAAVSAFWKSLKRSDPEARKRALAWLNNLQTKIVCKVNSEEELEAVAVRAETAGLIVARIHDAGHTQLEAGTFTCIGIGPDTSERLEAITGELKLL